ncbi:uncharacterized protein LOC120351548 [Nilaparvata lugens]|uniref:uncharacterized protein LOC120351548 n=1 Tax=Nilaparvata lugens TaxID=108931 RepID=UPI00193EA556|nr:uncharacterized protein LOC120351548 [Nilaparvata lugens]
MDMEICQSCDRDWDAHKNKIIIAGDPTFSSCPNAMDHVKLQQYPCPEAVLELGPICPVTCDLLTTCMAHPEQVSAEGRRFAAKFVFQRAMETVLNVDAAVEVATTVMAKEENEPVFTTRLTSCLDLTYIERENLIPMNTSTSLISSSDSTLFSKIEKYPSESSTPNYQPIF